MLRTTACLLSLSVVLFVAAPAQGQQLINKGILVTQILARTRMGIFERGDLLHVTVRQPAGNKGFTISVHAEYTDGAGKWQQVPAPKSMLGPVYKSNKYGGLRDYVDFLGTPQTIDRNIAMFMPFDGFALPVGKDYKYRYVIRLWEIRPGREEDKEISSLALEPYRIHVSEDSEGPLVTILDTKPCAFLRGPDQKGDSSRPAGIVRFFDATNGKWECPQGK